MPHLHLSLQSGDDMILKRMKRRHSRREAIDLCKELRMLRPDIVFSRPHRRLSDGNRGDVPNSLALIEDCGLTWLHVFPYSERDGTPAAKMPPVDRAVRKARAARLRDAGSVAVRQYLESRIGHTEDVLIEKPNLGRTAYFAPIRVDGDAASGAIVAARVTGVDGNGTFRDYLAARCRMSGGWLSRLKSGLAKSSSRLVDGIAGVFTRRRLDAEAIEELEDVLITADLGPATAARLAGQLADRRIERDVEADEVRRLLADDIAAILEPVAEPLKFDGSTPHIVLVVGVNGAGKTTTIGKLAKQMIDEGRSVLLAAGDTFRAAAIEQLGVWGERTGCRVVARETGSDPSGLIYDAIEQARESNVDVLLIDTAGRLHNKANLMAELEKIQRVIAKLDPTAPHEVLMVLDATTGQNAISQVETFKEMVSITGLVVTKLDGTAKGGVLVALADRFGLPVRAIGVGERIEDLRAFSARDFARNLMGLDANSSAA